MYKQTQAHQLTNSKSLLSRIEKLNLAYENRTNIADAGCNKDYSTDVPYTITYCTWISKLEVREHK